MKTLKLEIDEGKTITAAFRPPTREEIEKMTEMQKMGRLLSPDDREKKDDFVQAFTSQAFALGSSMLFRASGEVPEWAEDCQKVKDVVLKYYSSDVSRVAIESISEAVSLMMPMARVSEAVTKN